MSDYKPSACILCECNCGIQIRLGGEDGRRFDRIRGDKAHPSSKGYVCQKPARLDHYQNGPQRLTSPLRRREDGTFEAISWDVAIREVADRLARVRDRFGGKSIFYYGGGGQGNHLPGAYATATRRALGSVYKSSALAQEKTGEFWIADRTVGAMTRSDFEHCEVAFFLGKNPWQSHSFPRARVMLRKISRDPARTLIVVDPRRSETAELADIHLQLVPGTDAWLVSAMVAVLFDEDLLDHGFLAQANGVDAVRAVFADVDIAAHCAVAGLDEAQVREATRVIARSGSVASFEDLGVQMNRHSTVVSYLHRLLWLLTGNFGKPGTQYVPTPFVPFATGSKGHRSPVADALIINGLVPCNVIAEEILTDHPDRYRAMIVEASNPAHSLADSPAFREALAALDTVVVIDVAMSETARHADYVLPSASQFEKAEATFFNFEFPDNYFHLRPRLLDPPQGPLPEAEIHARLCEALGAFDDDFCAPLRDAAADGLPAFGMAFMQHVLSDPTKRGLAAVLLYRTLGPSLPVPVREGAVLLGLALRFAMGHPDALSRAGFGGPPPMAAMALFQAILDTPSGVVFAKGDWSELKPGTPSGRFELALDDMLDAVASLGMPPEADADWPFVLSAGERRAFTANTIIRDPAWRDTDPEGALRISPGDAAALGVSTGDRVALSTRRGTAEVSVEVSDAMRPGHVSLPNGLGLDVTNADGTVRTGVAANELTAAEDRDRYAGTPWHKWVPARLEAIPA